MSTTQTQAKTGKDVLLAAAEAKGKGEGAAKCPEVFRPECAAKTKRWQEIKAELKKMKGLNAELKAIEADLAPIAEQARIEESRRRRDSLSSVKLNGVLFVSQAKYPDIVNPEQTKAVRAVPDMALHLSEEGRVSYLPEELSPEWQEALAGLRKAGEKVAFDIDMSKLTEEMAEAIKDLKEHKLVTLTRRTVVDRELHRVATMNPEMETALRASGLRNVAFFRS